MENQYKCKCQHKNEKNPMTEKRGLSYPESEKGMEKTR